MREISVFNIKGELIEPYKDLGFFPVPIKMNRHVIFESVNVELQNSRFGNHKTKNKSEVSGTGKKPYKQKHTGRARQGSRRNPHFRGGGVAFGVTPEKNYRIRVNKKVFSRAWISCWSKILDSKQISILDNSVLDIDGKSKSFWDFLRLAKLSDKKKILLLSSFDEINLRRSAFNISSIYIRSAEECSVRDLLNQDYILITSKSLEEIKDRIVRWK